MNGTWGSISGARASSAGDLFHITWATRRTLGLLDPDSNLKMVVMEDLHPDGSAGLDRSLLHGVDVTEFYGHDSVKGANRIVVSQLKYSYSEPGRNWTASRLTKAGDRRRASVIKRLAQIYQAFVDRDRRNSVLGKLEIHLVSNQPVQQKLAQALDAAHQALGTHDAQITLAELLKRVPSESRGDLEKLHSASGLGSRRFTDFLRVLRLNTNEDGQLDQDIKVTEALAKHVKENLKHHSRAVYDMVMRRGLPDGDGGIYPSDLLTAMGVSGMDKLLPAPARFDELPRYLPTDAPGEILDALRGSPERILIAHGRAGVGKTTSARKVGELLPEGSVFIEFDCFAGGAYKAPSQARHMPERALLQLCNELAVKCRLPLLIVPPDPPYELWRELERRLAAAAENLQAAGSQIVLLIDAADNAAWAARQRGDECFVPDLWHLQIPEGVGIVVTARTERRGQLGAPTNSTEIELGGFGSDTSTVHLRTRFPEASDSEGAEFHKRSLGNPRVQSYVLGTRPSATLAGTVQRARRTQQQIFNEILSEAINQADDETWAADRLADLVCLASPTTSDRMAEVAHSTVESIAGFCLALVPGLRFDDVEITFQDEDFEKYAQDTVGAAGRREAHSRLADHYADRAGINPHAATVLAEHLRSAGRKEDLVTLAVEEDAAECIKDPIARLQVYRRRLRLALQAASSGGKKLAACKLLVLAGLNASSDSAVTNIVRRRPTLALRHGDPAAVEATWRDVRNLEWQGPVHMRLAALHARRGNPEDARAELRMTDAWMRRRYEETRQWDLKPSDHAAALEAVYLLHGWKRALQLARRWRPLAYRDNVCVALARRLRTDHSAQVCSEILGSTLPAVVKARMLVAVGPEPDAVSLEDLIDLARALTRRRTTRGLRATTWPTPFIELVARLTRDEKLTLGLLDKWEPVMPAWAPSRHSGLRDWEHVLRCRSLRAACEGEIVEIDDLMPISVTRDGKKADRARQEEESRAMHGSVGPLLPVYQRRASALIRRPMAHVVAQALEKEVPRRVRGSHDFERDHATTYIQWVGPACDVLCSARGSSVNFARQAAEAAESADGEDEIYVWKAMARKLIGDARYRELAYELIAKAAGSAEERDQPVEQLADFLLDLTETADPFDADLASDLYSRAIEAAKGLDDEVVALLATHTRLAPRLAGEPCAPMIAARVARSITAYRTRVSSEEMLPWEETVHAVTSTHPPSGAALAGRWEDRRHLRIEESLGPFLKAAVDSGYLDVSWALALIGLLGETTSWRRELSPLLTRLGAAAAEVRVRELTRLASIVIRDLSDDARASTASSLVQWAEGNGHRQLRAIIDLAPYLGDPTSRGLDYRAERKAQMAGLLNGAETASPSEIVARVRKLADRYGSDDEMAELLRRASKNRRPDARVALLDALAAISPDDSLMRFHAAGIVQGIAEIAVVSKDASVREWKSANVRRLALEEIPNLLRYSEHRESGVQAWSALVRQNRAKFAIDAAVRHIDHLPSHSLYALAESVARSLGKDDLEAFLDWSLQRVEDDADEPTPVDSLEPSEALAGLLWSLFANPEKPVRWRAAHATRRLLALEAGPGELAGELLKLSRTRDGGPFADSDLPFLWMSASVWTHMTLARVAADRPEMLVAHVEGLRGTALDGDWPHASLREFARRSALRVAAHDAEALSADSVDELRFANRPRLCQRERESHYRAASLDHPAPERWSFSMDVEDDWFVRLGRRFAKGMNEIGVLAEGWLIDVLGEPGEITPRRRDVRIARLDYSDLDIHHNSEPRAEDARMALEYHAMHLVGGRILDEKTPILVEEYDPPTDPWEDWIEHHLDASEHGWTVDRRDPTPPEQALLQAPGEGELWPPLGDDQFLLMLGRPGSDHVVVAGYLSYSYTAAYGWDSVACALVPAGLGVSLKHALDTAPEPQFFTLPMDEEDDYGEHVIDRGAFQLRPWLRQIRESDSNLEKHDPLARLNDELWTPGRGFRELHGTEVDPLTGAHVSADNRRLAWVRAFSDQPLGRPGRDIRGFYASGSQTFVDSRALLDFLKATGMSLIIKAEAIRHASRTNYGTRDEEPEENEEIRRTLLIEQDGRVNGLPGCRAIGQADS